MARPKVVRTKEEAAAVDPTLPIQVEVSSDPSVEVQAAPPATATANGKAGGGPSSSVGTAPPAAPPPPPAPEPELTSLKAQIEQMKKNHDEQARQIADFQRREAEMRRSYDDRDRQARTSAERAYQAEVDAVTNGIATFESELVGAKTAARIAATAGDWEAHGEANERISTAAWHLQEYKAAKARLDQQAERAKSQPPQYPQAAMSIEQQIDNDQRFTYPQKQWFKKHPDIFNDNYKSNKLGVAHYEAINKGLTQDSPEYFEAIDIAMGYKQAPQIEEDDGPPSPLPQSVSAPVSRESVSASTGRPTTTRITLTAAQREAARDAGVDEITYARGLLELERRKQAGLYQNG
jgi:hypothetical protein